jgi:hypothetical protein
MGCPFPEHHKSSGGGGGSGGAWTALAVVLAAASAAAAARPVVHAAAELVQAVLIGASVLLGLAVAAVVAFVSFRVWHRATTAARAVEPPPPAVRWTTRTLPEPREPRPALERPAEVHVHLHGVQPADIAAMLNGVQPDTSVWRITSAPPNERPEESTP